MKFYKDTYKVVPIIVSATASTSSVRPNNNEQTDESESNYNSDTSEQTDESTKSDEEEPIKDDIESNSDKSDSSNNN